MRIILTGPVVNQWIKREIAEALRLASPVIQRYRAARKERAAGSVGEADLVLQSEKSTR